MVIDLAFVHRVRCICPVPSLCADAPTGGQRQEVREMELHIVERNYDPTQFLAEHPNHIPCVALNREHHQGGRYCYHQENADMILLPEKAVHITTLAYAPEFDVVAIGFSFGTFQLWSLMSHRLLHSSPIGEGGTMLNSSCDSLPFLKLIYNLLRACYESACISLAISF